MSPRTRSACSWLYNRRRTIAWCTVCVLFAFLLARGEHTAAETRENAERTDQEIIERQYGQCITLRDSADPLRNILDFLLSPAPGVAPERAADRAAYRARLFELIPTIKCEKPSTVLSRR